MRTIKEGAIPIIIQSREKRFTQLNELQEKGINSLFCNTKLTNPVAIDNTLKII